MVDINFIRDNIENIKQAVINKNLTLNVDELLSVDDKRRELLSKVEQLNAQRNSLNDELQKAEDKNIVIAKGREVKEKLAQLEPEYEDVKQQFENLIIQVPTIPSEDTPVGKSDADNVEIYHGGEVPKFDFAPKDHVEIGKYLDILDLEKGAKVGGYRGYYLKNEGAMLVMAIMMYALNKMAEKGYSLMIPPTIVKSFSLFGSGYFKGREYNPETDEIYQIASSDRESSGEVSGDQKFLVGTSEPSLLAYYSGDLLKEENLPLRVSGYSQCYRSEIGSYGKDTKGMYRVHEFMKVEQVILSKADVKEAEKLQDEMVGISQEMHEELGLPYRKLQICTGDMSAGKYRQFDLEAWMPGLNRWGETGSASIFLDWQSRRLNVKYVDKNGERKYVYMLNNTALPSPRIFIAILENYQQADGSVIIPEVLRKYTGFDLIKPKKAV